MTGRLSAVLFLFLILLDVPAMAGPFSSGPGSRARSMAGAFSAVADDPSAVWYNPAGLADQRHDLLAEWSQAVITREKEGSLNNSQNSWFAGGSLYTKYGNIGLFFLSPYTPKYWAADTGRNRTAWGQVHEVMRMYSLAYAVPLLDQRLKIGATFEFVDISIGDSDIFFRDAFGVIRMHEPGSKQDDTFSGSAGIKYNLIDPVQNACRLTVGLVYRLASNSDIGLKAADGLFFDKPASFDIGLAYKQIFSDRESFLISLQYGQTDWDKAQSHGADFSYATYAVGLEYRLTDPSAMFKTKTLRAGYYLSDPSGDQTTFGSPIVSGVTWGLGFTVGDIRGVPERGDRLTVDAGQELREHDNSWGRESTLLSSITISWSIF